jgi:hypothetical protein
LSLAKKLFFVGVVLSTSAGESEDVGGVVAMDKSIKSRIAIPQWQRGPSSSQI